MALSSSARREIYIRVPRTGSTSFIRGLGGKWREFGHVHCSARDILANPRGYRSFGFIRNPWDWFVSAYSVGWSGGCNGIKEVWPGSRIEPFDAPGIHYGQRTNYTFEEWVYLRKTTPMDWLCDGSDILVDEIRRFEDMKFKTHEQKSDRLPYQKYYTPELAEFVEKKCAREVEIGGYEF